MPRLEHSKIPITRPADGKYTAKKRRRSESKARRIRQRQLGSQSIIPCKVNIQSLPEDVALRITSQLTLREAAQMSVLSSTWRQACVFHPDLYFDTQTVLGESHSKRTQGMSSDHSSKSILTINKFIERVDAILKNHCGAQVNKFAVEFGLWTEHADHINRWVSFVVTSKARVVVLDLSPNRNPPFARDNYEFPFQLFNAQNGSYLQALKLNFVALGPPPDFCGFANLKTLALECVCLLEDLQHLLSKCRMLEWLSMCACYWLSSLRVREPLYRLQYLRVQYCALPDGIEFHAPNLKTFEYDGFPTLMDFSDCLNLKMATIRLKVETLEYVLTKIPIIFPHVETISLDLLISTKMSGFLQSPLKFIRLRHLTVEINYWRDKRSIFQLAYLLEAAPLLEELHLNMFRLDLICCPMDLDEIMDLPHYHLKTACIVGFCGDAGQVELAKYILRNASTLEHLILTPGGKYDGSTEPSALSERYGRKVAKEKLAPLDMNGVLEIL